MNITIAINTNREIGITIAIHVPAFLSIFQNSYYHIVTLISLFCPCRCNHVRLFCHDICTFFYSRSKTSEILQLYPCLHLNAYYNQTYTNINFIVVLIKIHTMGDINELVIVIRLTIKCETND